MPWCPRRPLFLRQEGGVAASGSPVEHDLERVLTGPAPG